MTGLPSVNTQEFMQFPGFPELKWGYRVIKGFSKDKLGRWVSTAALSGSAVNGTLLIQVNAMLDPDDIEEN